LKEIPFHHAHNLNYAFKLVQTIDTRKFQLTASGHGRRHGRDIATIPVEDEVGRKSMKWAPWPQPHCLRLKLKCAQKNSGG
jgi:hypothetical protein